MLTQVELTFKILQLIRLSKHIQGITAV